MNNKSQELIKMRKEAKHGDFFFSQFLIDSGEMRHSPVFVISAAGNDMDDVIVCKCTGQPAKTDYDIRVN